MMPETGRIVVDELHVHQDRTVWLALAEWIRLGQVVETEGSEVAYVGIDLAVAVEGKPDE